MNELPSITVQEVAQKIENSSPFFLVDVREMNEVDAVSIPAEFLEMALSEVQSLEDGAIPMEIEDEKDAEIVVFCHHGSRSAMATQWLIAQGFTNVKNMTGGIHAYALEIDPSIGTY